MKILQICNRFYPYIGGTENYIYNLSKELVKLGHKVTVICADEPKTGNGIIDGVNVIRIKYIFKIANTNITPLLPLVILKQDFDIIHSHIPHPWSVDWAALFAFIRSKPLIITYHNDITERGKYRFLTWIYNRVFLKIILAIAGVIINTQEKYLEYSRHLEIYKDKIKVIPCGVDIEKFYPLNLTKKDNLKRVFFLSVLDEYHRYKGLDYLLKAFAKIIEKRKNVLLVIGGDGVLRREYENMAKDLSIDSYVNFLGVIPKDKLNYYFNDCDVFVLPSVSSEQEGFGIVVLEAMACEKPVVVTNITGVSEYIERFNTGKVVSPKDVTFLAGSMMQILEDRETALQMSRNGRMLVENRYGWNKAAGEVLNIYRNLI